MIDNFCVLCPILEVSMIDRNVAGKFCGVAITMGEFLNNDTKDEGKSFNNDYKIV